MECGGPNRVNYFKDPFSELTERSERNVGGPRTWYPGLRYDFYTTKVKIVREINFLHQLYIA